MALLPLSTHRGIIIPLDRDNVDTDAILPKQYLKKLEADGYQDFLFDDERYLDPGDVDVPVARRRKNPECIFNQSPFNAGTVLLSRDNFGCGSSREHAVWAIRDFGIKVLVASGFGDIFRNNCFNNGLLPIVLPSESVDELFRIVRDKPGVELEVSVADGMFDCDGKQWSFDLEAGRAEALLKGLDEIGMTLERAESIKTYEAWRREQEPWLFSA